MSTGFVIGLEEEEVVVPAEATTSLAAFRRWATSDDFPQSGRIDYVSGNIEISEMSGEDLLTHGTVKMELARGIATEVQRLRLGYAFVDRARVSCPDASVSAEPDVVVVKFSSIKAGRVMLVPKASREFGRYVELEGPPDLVVEVVSDSTIRKDTVRLPRSYFAARVNEFWLADGRKPELTFVVHARGESGFEPVSPDDEGFQRSELLGKSFRLDRTQDELGAWRYDLLSK